MSTGVSSDEETVQALTAVLQRARPERYTALSIRCANDHTVGRVYRTAVGLVLVHARDGVKRERTTDLPGFGQVALPPARGPRAGLEAWRLGPPEGETYRMQCRCSSVVVRDLEIDEALANGRKRLRVSR